MCWGPIDCPYLSEWTAVMAGLQLALLGLPGIGILSTQRGRILLAGSACSGLFIGTVCSWSAISSVLLPDGVFRESDAPTENLLVIYSVAVCAMSLSGTPAGLLCDRAPLEYGVVVAGACVVLGSLLIGVLPSSSGFNFMPPFMLLAIGGNTCFFAATKMSFLFPNARRPAIIATVCALYEYPCRASNPGQTGPLLSLSPFARSPVPGSSPT